MLLSKHRRAPWCAGAIAIVAALLSSCASDVAAPDANVRQVVVTPKNATSFANRTVQFAAEGLDANGVAVPGLVFTWSVDSTSRASVSAAGLLQPTGKRGTVTVTARTESGLTGSAPITLILPATSLAVVAGGQQTGVVGQALPQPIVVEAKDAEGVTVPGVSVTFAAPVGASVSATTATTDGAGRASVAATLATASGSQAFSISAEGLSATATETARADAPAAIAIVSGDGQADTVHKALPAPFVVKVVDKYNNAAPGAGVSWSRVGSGSLASSAAVTADNGQTSATYVLGATAGNESVTAAAAGVTAGVTFSVRAIASIPDLIAVVSGADQVAAALTRFDKALTVRVNDARGYPIAGAPVQWAGNNVSLSSSTSTTDAAGEASVSATAGSAAGAASVAVTSGGRSVAISLGVAAGSPARIVFRTQPQNAVARAVMTPFQVALVDAGGNPTLSNTGLRVAVVPGTGSPIGGVSGSTGNSAVNGVLTFNSLFMNVAGTGYRLQVTAPFLSGVAPGTSEPFDVTEPPVSVTVVSVLQTTCPILSDGPCVTSGPANLLNAADDLNVKVSIDGLYQAAIAILRCGTDSVTGITYTSNNEPSITVTIPTAMFERPTGAVHLKNGSCTLRTTATPTIAGAQVISRTPPMAVTLNNTDVIFGRVSVPRAAVGDPSYLNGPVTITALPLLYSGRTATAATIGLTASGGTSSPLPAPTTKTGAPFAVTLPLAGVTARNIGLTGSVQLSGGGTLTGFAAVIANADNRPFVDLRVPWNVDNQAPRAGVFPLGWNTQRNNQAESADGAFLGASFVFASNVGFCGPNGPGFNPANAGTANPVCTPDPYQSLNLDARDNVAGIGGVTVVFQAATSLAGPFSTVTGTTSLAESPAYDTYILRQITTDLLGNADTSFADGTPFSTSAVLTHKPTRFGVDKTPPTVSLVSGPANGARFQVNSSGNPAAPAAGSAGNFVVSASDNLSGLSRSSVTGAPQLLVAQTRTSMLTNPGIAAADGSIYSNSQATGVLPVARSTVDRSPCSIGQFSRSGGGGTALVARGSSGSFVGACAHVPYDPGASSLVPAAAAPGSEGGYYTTSIIAVDAAGNRSSPIVVQLIEDAIDPVTTSLDAPGGTLAGGLMSMAAAGTDNLNLVASFSQVTYPDAGMVLQYPFSNFGIPSLGDQRLVQSTGMTTNTSPFIPNLQSNNGTGPVATTTTAAGKPSQITVAAVDAAERSSPGRTISFAGLNVPVTGPNTFSANFTSGFSISTSASSVSNCAGCSNTITLKASAGGTTGVFANPFGYVSFWYQAVANGPWHYAGSAFGATARETGGTRFWDCVFVWDPPDAAPVQLASVKPNLVPAVGQTISIQVRAIGATTPGDGVASPPITITLRNP